MGYNVARCVARIWKRGGFFERVRKVQTTLTRIFIVLESVSHGLSENWDKISRKAQKFKGFFRPKSGDLQKKRSLLKLRLIGNSYVRGGLFFLWGGYFQFFTKNRPQKHQKRAILHTSQTNGGLEPPLATLLNVANASTPLRHFFKRSFVAREQWHGDGSRQLITRFGVLQRVWRKIWFDYAIISGMDYEIFAVGVA